MIYFRNGDDSLDGLARAAQSVIGRLGLYRESFRMIVRILDARVTEKTPTGGAWLDARIETLAICNRFGRDMSDAIGRVDTVSCSLPPVFHGGMWSIEPLAALTIEDAIKEAERAMGAKGLVWQR